MDINDSLLTTISNNGAKNIFSDIGEITIDSIIQNDAIDSIPIIGTLKSLFKITNSVSDYLFIQKLLKFIFELGEITEEQKESMQKRLKSDETYQNKLGDQLLEIINKIDDTEKPKLIAKVFRAYIQERISLQQFFKYSQIINRAFLPDLYSIEKIISGNTLTVEESSSLLSLGLLEVKTKTKQKNISIGDMGKNNQIEFVINPIGKKIFELID